MALKEGAKLGQAKADECAGNTTHPPEERVQCPPSSVLARTSFPGLGDCWQHTPMGPWTHGETLDQCVSCPWTPVHGCIHVLNVCMVPWTCPTPAGAGCRFLTCRFSWAHFKQEPALGPCSQEAFCSLGNQPTKPCFPERNKRRHNHTTTSTQRRLSFLRETQGAKQASRASLLFGCSLVPGAPLVCSGAPGSRQAGGRICSSASHPLHGCECAAAGALIHHHGVLHLEMATCLQMDITICPAGPK